MLGSEFRKRFASRPPTPVRSIFQALTNSFYGVLPRGKVKQMLVGSRALNHQFRFALMGKDQGAPTLLK